MRKRSGQQLSRRILLRGAAGSVVALPFLESLASPGRAEAQVAPPLRFLVTFAGVSLPSPRYSIPSATGSQYTLPRAFRDLSAVQDHVSLISGLDVEKVSEGEKDRTPPGGSAGHHNQQVTPILTGIRGLPGTLTIRTKTSDQYAAEALGRPSSGFASRAYSVQPESYVSGRTAKMSHDGSRGLEPESSPREAYRALFEGFSFGTSSSGGAGEGSAVLQNLERRGSVLDFVMERTRGLIARVSQPDRIRLEQHLEEIRTMERRLAELSETSGTSATMTRGCAVPPDPGAEPARQTYTAISQTNSVSVGYSDEDRRAQILSDMTHLAFACDRTRAVSMLWTYPQCQMAAEPLLGVPFTFHGIGHAGDGNGAGQLPDKQTFMADCAGWHVKHFGRLIELLATTPEDSGSMMIDHTVAVLLFEGGSTSAHGTENMTAVIAGRGSVLRLGEHFHLAGAHPSHVLQTALHAIGVDIQYGEVPETLDAILR